MKAGIKEFIKMIFTWCCGGNNILFFMLKNVIRGGEFAVHQSLDTA